MLKVSTNNKSFIAEFKRVTQKEFPRAHVRATNSAAFGRRGQGSVKGDLARHVANDLNLKLRSSRKAVKVWGKAKVISGRVSTAKIAASTKPSNLISLKGTRQTKKGVSYKFGKKKLLFKGAFIINSSKGKYVGIRKGNEPYPLRGVTTPSVGGVAHARYQKQIGEWFNERYDKEFHNFLNHSVKSRNRWGKR